jgi:hypothetical protein
MLSIESEMLGALLSSGLATLIYLLAVLFHVDDHQAIIGGQRRVGSKEHLQIEGQHWWKHPR